MSDSSTATVAVFARLVVKPDAAAQAEAALARLVEAARDEDGTLQYVLHKEGDATFWFYELYRDADALTVHSQGPALSEVFGELGSLLAEPPALHVTNPLAAKGLDL